MQKLLKLFQTSETWGIIFTALLPLLVSHNIIPPDVAKEGGAGVASYTVMRIVSKVIKGVMPFLHKG